MPQIDAADVPVSTVATPLLVFRTLRRYHVRHEPGVTVVGQFEIGEG
jgi:hypothetical protein